MDTIADYISKEDEIKELKRQLANIKANREREIKAAQTSVRKVWQDKLSVSADKNAKLRTQVSNAKVSRDLAQTKFYNLKKSHDLLVNNKIRIARIVAKMKMDGLTFAQNNILADRCFVSTEHFNNTMSFVRSGK